MIVPKPPIEDAYAIASINAFLKWTWCSPPSSDVAVMIAIPIGSIMMAVAVFEIHIDRNAVEIINPRMIMLSRVPMLRMIFTAIRRWSPVFSIAIAIRNPPIYKKTIGCPYDAVVSPSFNTPVRGNKIIGKRDVAANGIGSVIHHMAIQAVMLMTMIAALGIPAG